MLRALGLSDAEPAEGLAAVVRILETISDAFLFVDRDARLRYVNARAAQMLGRAPAALLGKRIWTELPEVAGSAFQVAYERAVGEQTTVQIEEHFAPLARWFEARIHPSPDGVAVFFQDVTERRAAAAQRDALLAQLQEEQQARAQAERVAHLGFWQWDVAANRVTWSDELRRIYGVGPDAVESFETYLERVHPSDRARVEQTVRDALERRESFSMEERIVRPNGEPRHLRSWGRVKLDASGVPTAMIGVCLDMTDLAATTAALTRSKQWLDIALGAARMGLWDWDVATNEVRWSEGVERVFGIPPGTFAGTYAAYVDLIHPGDRARLEATIARTIEEGGDYEIEHRIVRPDGTLRWLHGSGRGFRDASGKVVRMAGSVVDATDRRHADEERRLYALIVERATDFIGLAGVDGRILYINDAGLRMVGLPSLEEARKRRVGDLLTPEGVQHSLEAELPAVLEVGHWQGDGQLVNLATGARIDVATTSFVVRDPSTNEVLCLATLRRDVTARRALEAQLRQSQKMEVVGRLAAGIAHDFNNLLTIIVGMSGLVIARAKLDDAARASIGEIESAAQRASALTRQLLTFGRQQVLDPRVFDAGEIVGDASKLLARLLPANIEMTLELAREPLPVRVDRNMLEQVLLNLVVNARDAMPKGGRLTMTARAEGPSVVLAVRDTGTGMTSEVRERAFEPFFTTKAVGHGTGLGLSMVYAVVQQSGGEVSVESAPGAGATFTIRLPRDAEPVEASTTRARRARTGDARGTVLVVDDDEPVRRTMKRILDAEGYRVLEASSGENALRIVTTHGGAIDLLVTDLRMPKMDGRELARRAREEYPDLPVLLVTGYVDEAGIPSASVLLKPFTADTLVRRVEKLLAATDGTPVSEVSSRA